MPIYKILCHEGLPPTPNKSTSQYATLRNKPPLYPIQGSASDMAWIALALKPAPKKPADR